MNLIIDKSDFARKIITIILTIFLFTKVDVEYRFMVGYLFVVLFFLNTKVLYGFKNFFLVYVFLFFSVGTTIYAPNDFEIRNDFYYFTLSFIFGYSCSNFINKIHKKSILLDKISPKQITKILNIAIFIKTLELLSNYVKVGFLNFYSGGYLEYKFFSYGSENTDAGIYTIIEWFSTYFSVAVIAISVYYSTIKKINLPIKIYFTLLILFPALSLSRSEFMMGTLTLLNIILFNRNRNKTILNNFALVLPIVAILFALYVDTVRSQKYGNSELSFNVLGLFDSFSGELSTFQAYKEVKENISDLKFQNGNTIFLPLLLKIVPRNIYPSKPHGSSGYVAIKLHKDDFDRGLMFAVPLFGDLYLNFGILGSLVCIFFIGIYFGIMDRVILKSIASILIILMIVSVHNMYSLLRNDLLASISGIMFPMITVFTYMKILKIASK